MNETMNDALNAVKLRLTGPLGYISTSFIIYNWAWFYYLIFSDKPAEVKITTIVNSFPMWSGFIYPIAFGFSITIITTIVTVICIPIAMPYISAKIREITHKARISEKKSDKDEANFAEDYDADKKAVRVQKEYDTTIKTAEIEKIKKQRDDIAEEISQHQSTINDLLIQESTLRRGILSATQEKYDIEYSISKLKIEKNEIERLNVEIERLKTELAQALEWNQVYRDAAEKNDVQLITLSNLYENLALLSKTIKNIPGWDEQLSKDDKETINSIING